MGDRQDARSNRSGSGASIAKLLSASAAALLIIGVTVRAAAAEPMGSAADCLASSSAGTCALPAVAPSLLAAVQQLADRPEDVPEIDKPRLGREASRSGPLSGFSRVAAIGSNTGGDQGGHDTGKAGGGTQSGDHQRADASGAQQAGGQGVGPQGNRSGLGDGTNPGKSTQDNGGTANPGGAQQSQDSDPGNGAASGNQGGKDQKGKGKK